MGDDQPELNFVQETRKHIDIADQLNDLYDILISYDIHEPEKGSSFRDVVSNVFALLHRGSRIQDSVFLFRSKKTRFSKLKSVVDKIIVDTRFDKQKDKILICKVSDLGTYPGTIPNPSTKSPYGVLNANDIIQFS